MNIYKTDDDDNQDDDDGIVDVGDGTDHDKNQVYWVFTIKIMNFKYVEYFSGDTRVGWTDTPRPSSLPSS